ncbi:MAG: RNA polymerase sigma factor [Solirubrobacterales bacterium]
MKRPRPRSKGVNQTLTAPASDAPADADLAFEQLYRSSRDDVYAYVAGLLRDRSAAEEVTAAVFERAFRKRRRFDARRGSGRAWLFGIARNAAIDELRHKRRRADLTAEPADAEIPATDVLAEGGARRATVIAALSELEPRDRELVAMKFFAGLSNAEIAAVLGISESNAGTKLHRVITKLREACR